MLTLRTIHLTSLARPVTKAIRYQGTSPPDAGGISLGPRVEDKDLYENNPTNPAIDKIKEEPKGKKPGEIHTSQFNVQDKTEKHPKSGSNAEEVKEKAKDEWGSVKNRVKKSSETEHGF